MDDKIGLGLGLWCLMPLSTNNISVILWWSVLLVEDTEVPRENHRPTASHWKTLSHNVALSTPRLVIGNDCIGSYKFNYHTITTMTAPWMLGNVIYI